MTHTTTTPPPARGGVTCICSVCGIDFPAHHHRSSICSDRCRKEKARQAKELYRYRVANGLVRDRRPLAPRITEPRAVVVRRASTLAETPDVPAVTAARGDFLTGAAAATMQAVSGGRNLSL